MLDETFDPSKPSADNDAMSTYWRLVRDILDGAPSVRAGGELYLPRFAEEGNDDYDYRRKTAKFVGIYRDIVESLAAKPFSKEVQVVEKSASDEVRALTEDIDAHGNNLHVFAQRTFFEGVNNAVDWILVDYQNTTGRNLTIADTKDMGLRPYWVHIRAPNMLAAETAMIKGEEQFVHVRIRESVVERDGFDEKVVERVRVLRREKLDGGEYGPATWAVYKKVSEARFTKARWEKIDEGVLSIGVIPLVPFIAGRRKGSSWQFVPPMQDAAYLQIEHYQAESALKSIKDMCCFPMLSGEGVAPEKEGARISTLRVGPRSVLYAPPDSSGNHGSWKYVEPAAASLEFLAKNIDTIEQQLRELGRQPLTARTGNLTVVTTAFAANKANSVISAWALNLKDALERAFQFTAMWLGEEPAVEVEILSDFDLDIHEDKSLAELLEMRKNGDLSQESLWREFKRRGVLSAEFNADDEMGRLLNEIPGEPTYEELQQMGVTPLRSTGTEG